MHTCLYLPLLYLYLLAPFLVSCVWNQTEDTPPCPDPYELFPCTCEGVIGGDVVVTCDGVVEEWVARRALHSPRYPSNPLHSFSMEWGGVSSIEDDFFGERQFTQVSLGHNRIASVGGGVWRPLNTSLASLDLQHNALAHAVLPQLVDFPNLWFVSQSYNQIRDLDDLVSLGPGSLPWVSRLLLAGNLISAVPYAAFQCVPNVQVLDLSFNNISYIHIGAFEGVGRLGTLALGGNRLNQLGSLEVGRIVLPRSAGLVSLMDADVTTLHHGFVEGLDDTSMLDLSSNPLEALPQEVFQDLLQDLTVSDIPYRTGIRIYRTWVACDCSLLWLSRDRWLDRHVFGGWCSPRDPDWKEWRSIHTIDTQALEQTCSALTTTPEPPNP